MTQQFNRKASLIVTRPGAAGLNPEEYTPGASLDLSELHFQFKTSNADHESPSNCMVRVFNLSKTTVESIIKAGFSQVTVQGGYDGTFGIVFQGTIKQFRVGALSNVDTYLDILAADGDIAYNFGVVSATIGAGMPKRAAVEAVIKDWSKYGVSTGADLGRWGGVINIRGKVLWGLGRAHVRDATESIGATWSIQNGKVNIIPLEGYLPGEAVKLTSATGLIGIPEQTQEGIKLRCLMNPKIIIGGRIQLDNKLVNQTIAQSANSFAGSGSLPFDKFGPIQYFANVTNDGFYRVYVAEHVGDTRGQDWYTDLIVLAIDSSTNKVNANG